MLVVHGCIYKSLEAGQEVLPEIYPFEQSTSICIDLVSELAMTREIPFKLVLCPIYSGDFGKFARLELSFYDYSNKLT